MWTWHSSSQWGNGATVSFNAVNSPAFSSSLAFPFFVPGHLIAALIYSSTRLPLPIYWYFMKITPLIRVNVCLFSPSLPLWMLAPKLHKVPCKNFCDIRQIKQYVSPKAQRDERGEWMKGDQTVCQQALSHLFLGILCVCFPLSCMAHSRKHYYSLIRIRFHSISCLLVC